MQEGVWEGTLFFIVLAGIWQDNAWQLIKTVILTWSSLQEKAEHTHTSKLSDTNPICWCSFHTSGYYTQLHHAEKAVNYLLRAWVQEFGQSGEDCDE